MTPDFPCTPREGIGQAHSCPQGPPQFTPRDPAPDSRLLRLGSCGLPRPTLSCWNISHTLWPRSPPQDTVLPLSAGGSLCLPRPFLHAPLTALAQILRPMLSTCPSLVSGLPSPLPGSSLSTEPHPTAGSRLPLSKRALGHFPTQGPTMALSAWLIKFKFPNLASGFLPYLAASSSSSSGRLHCLPPSLICRLCSHLITPHHHATLLSPPFPHPGSSHRHPSQAHQGETRLPGPSSPQRGHWICSGLHQAWSFAPRPYPFSVPALPPSGRHSLLPSSLPFAQILTWTWNSRQTSSTSAAQMDCSTPWAPKPPPVRTPEEGTNSFPP